MADYHSIIIQMSEEITLFNRKGPFSVISVCPVVLPPTFQNVINMETNREHLSLPSSLRDAHGDGVV